MLTSAQSIGALLLQLRELGAGIDDLRYLQSCYRVTQALLFAAFRGSGKPLTAHAVGTASYTAHLDPAPRTVAAALLHPVYFVGVFPDGGRGINDENRRKLQGWVGKETEELVLLSETIRLGERQKEFVAAPDAIDPLTKAASRIQLANVADNLSGLGGALVPNGWYMKESVIRAFARIAEAFGHPAFARELLRLFEENKAAASWTAALRRDPIPDYELLPSPASYRETSRRTTDIRERRLRLV